MNKHLYLRHLLVLSSPTLMVHGQKKSETHFNMCFINSWLGNLDLTSCTVHTLLSLPDLFLDCSCLMSEMCYVFRLLHKYIIMIYEKVKTSGTL